MSSRKLIFIGIGAVFVGTLAAALLYGLMQPSDPDFISPANGALVAQGKVIYANHCAACHGASLQGQPNWRERLTGGRLPAPPHDKTGHTWHHPDAVLIDIVTNGLVPGRTAPAGYVSDMPAFGGVLSREQVVSVLAYIKSSWPPEILRLQKEVTLEHQ